jgi:hypothetical protein
MPIYLNFAEHDHNVVMLLLKRILLDVSPLEVDEAETVDLHAFYFVFLHPGIGVEVNRRNRHLIHEDRFRFGKDRFALLRIFFKSRLVQELFELRIFPTGIIVTAVFILE